MTTIANPPITSHCFSIDVEGFAESNAESFSIASELIGSRTELDEIQANVDAALQLLSQFKVKATFFCLGHLAADRPQIIRSIAKEGHEISSHGYHHKRLFDLQDKEVIHSITRSKQELEQVAGQKVFGFRAPDFSIRKSNLDALDLIQQAGYLYDSSIYPVSMHDVYGVQGAERKIHTLSNGLIEFPPASIKILGGSIPVLGGGYFRLSPIWFLNRALRYFSKSGIPAMIYLHPYEIGDRYPRLDDISYYRRFRHCVNMSKGKQKLGSIFKEHAFRPAIDFIRLFGK